MPSAAGLGFFQTILAHGWLTADVDTPDRFFLQPVIRGLDRCANRRDLARSSQDKGLWSSYFNVRWGSCPETGAGRKVG